MNQITWRELAEAQNNLQESQEIVESLWDTRIIA